MVVFFREKANYTKGHVITEGYVFMTESEFRFEPIDSAIKPIVVSSYRIVQCGFRKHFMLVPYKFYIKTSSGMVWYFDTFKARKISKIIESFIY